MNPAWVMVTGCLLLISGYTNAADKIVFSGSLPHDSYQPTVIIPLLTEALRRNGYEAEFVKLPAKRSLALSNSGMTDGEIHRVSNFHEVSGNQYPNLIRIESKMLSVFLSTFSLKGLKAPNNLTGLNIGYKLGEENTKNLLTKRYPESYLHTTASNEISFRMLINGRIDIAISESEAGKKLINNDAKYKDVIELSHIQKLDIYSYIHCKHSHLAENIAATLELMKQDGTFSQIKEKFLAEYYSK